MTSATLAQDVYKENIKAAKKGDATAQNIIGACYYNGKGCPQDYGQALFWWLKAAEQGVPEAQFCVGVCYANHTGTNTDFNKAFYWFKKAAEQGSNEAQNSLGNCYNSGEGVDQNFAEAYKWYTKSAEQGNMYAQFNLSTCYYYGRGVEVNKEKAFYWAKLSAEQGFVSAQFNLGSKYFYGIGVNKNVALGLEWWTKAAEQGNADAQFDLSNCYYNGDGVEKDLAKSIYWGTKAAENGSRDAQYNLSLSYYNGDGVEKDLIQSFYWCKKAAELGHASAQLNLGVDYFIGAGVAQNMEQGAYWYQKAAEQGKAGAQYNLGTCYYNGWGVAKNYDQALIWIKKAANQGHNQAKEWLSVHGAESKDTNNEISSSSNSNYIISDVDIDIPVNNSTLDNYFAVVIGNENYKNEVEVPYAKNDASIFRKYINNTFGISNDHIKYLENASYNDIRMAINWLVKSMELCNGKGRAILYYAGHGIPSESDYSAYLLPVDGIGNDPESAYGLKELYLKLGSVESISTTIFLDACFSGSKREEGMLSVARGVAIKARPATPKGNMVVLTAAQGDETAYPYKEKQHGMFTYFLLKKIKDTKGDVSMGELCDYVCNEVARQSFVKNGKTQTPTVNVSSALNKTWRKMLFK